VWDDGHGASFGRPLARWHAAWGGLEGELEDPAGGPPLRISLEHLADADPDETIVAVTLRFGPADPARRVELEPGVYAVDRRR
jgi:hypothetical protein